MAFAKKKSLTQVNSLLGLTKASQLFQLLAVYFLRILFAAKLTIIHRICRKSDESWVGRLGQIWLKPDIKYKYLVILLYF
jgi:hypothetical protein